MSLETTTSLGWQALQFSLIYVLLIIVIAVMKAFRIDKAKVLLVASIKMTVQLILAGILLTYIFQYPHPAFTVLYLLAMLGFAIYTVWKRNPNLNRRFHLVIAASMSVSSIFIIVFFIALVVRENVLNPQYAIPLYGMVVGNSMTGVTLGLKTFQDVTAGQTKRINALLCFGAGPREILFPFVKQSLETAMVPTINSMIGMGIVFLPGMMTGQILAGALPMTAIFYQIAIMIAITTVVTCACFGSLYFGFQTLFDKDTQIIRLPSVEAES
ncbi:MAG: ABC transporter permease [Mobiluncus porci]|uniref:ABC transporter permease n=1 Tax=Mobiluncus porci TaxID=2652278 RepID=UPI0023F4DF2C|nr:ABC transporter permease [Mobiluncus porci]MDD7541693.1 ABC transporter permease [Mobiluncus porci]MDY5749264.1 ABC transporter permease [Mobiluncus porci]